MSFIKQHPQFMQYLAVSVTAVPHAWLNFMHHFWILKVLLYKATKVDVRTGDRPKFGFGFGAEYSNLNCFGKFRFPPNIDLRLSANIRFRPKKFRGFGEVPNISSHCRNIYETNQTGPPDGLQSNKVYDTAVTGCTDRHLCNLNPL